MNYTEEELCTLVDQLPDIQYNLQMPVTSINLLGLTPDLFDEEVYEILKDYFTEQKYNVLTSFLYHDTSLDMAGYADVNIVVSVKGLKIAELLKEKYGTPYVVGFPYGKFSSYFFMAVEQALETGIDQIPYQNFFRLQTEQMIQLHGDPVIMSSIGFSLSQQYDFGYQVISDRKETLGTVDFKDTKKDDIQFDITFPLHESIFNLTIHDL